jgi:hypothetical protein
MVMVKENLTYQALLRLPHNLSKYRRRVTKCQPHEDAETHNGYIGASIIKKLTRGPPSKCRCRVENWVD